MRWARELALMVGFAALVALCAQVTVRLPFTPVPITGQTFGVLVAGGALGMWRGAGSLAIYFVAGTAGLPVFAPNLPMDGQVVHFILPWQGFGGAPWDLTSGGYLVGFIAAAMVAGYFAQKGWDRKPWVIGGFLLSNAVLYIPGLLWLAYLLGSGWVHPAVQRPLAEIIPGASTLEKTLVGGLYPYIMGDLVKLYLASLALPSAWALVRRTRQR
ncbi:MAG: biotin transporter BioY [Chloroflexi bacterium]|nr:biotin transporter BioY [Chloroflexota bacterium]